MELNWLTGGCRSTLSKFQQCAAIPLRLIVGYGFIAHGYAKIVKGPDHFFAILHALGVPAPQLMGWATILIELFGGLAVLAGAFVALASVPMALARFSFKPSQLPELSLASLGMSSISFTWRAWRH